MRGLALGVSVSEGLLLALKRLTYMLSM